MPRIWQPGLPPSDSSQPAPPHDPGSTLPPMPAPTTFRSSYSSGPSGPMFVDQAPTDPQLVASSSPSGSRSQSPHSTSAAPTSTTPMAIPPGAVPMGPDGQAIEAQQQLLLAAEQAAQLFVRAAAESSHAGVIANTDSNAMPRLTLRSRDGRHSPKPESFYAPNAAELYSRATLLTVGNTAPGEHPELPFGAGDGGVGANHYPLCSTVPRLPPILQVEKQQVTTSATQAASASRRRNEANFACPVPGCGSTFTRRFNLRGHLRSHTEERPYVCDFPGCKKGFARQHDCKRHQALHTTAKSQSNICQGCKKTFSRLDALNRHLRSEGGAECRQKVNGNQDLENKQQGPPPLEAPAH